MSLKPSICILTGPPAAGKNTIAGVFAKRQDACAVIDVDIVRWMALQPHKAPWEGAEGARQQELGVRNTCMLARSFIATNFSVVILDVVCERTSAIYRVELRDYRPHIILLLPSFEEITHRAKTRPPRLQQAEIAMLYGQQQAFRDYDHQIDNTNLSAADVAERLEELMSIP